jgi:hypothetical protein
MAVCKTSWAITLLPTRCPTPEENAMITFEPIKNNEVRVIIPEKIQTGDFVQLAPQADAFIREHGTIRLLVDARKFNGWEDMKAFDKHMYFVKTHQKKVERIAIIAGHVWQHWLAGILKIFVHPQVAVFDADEAADAGRWLSEEYYEKS